MNTRWPDSLFVAKSDYAANGGSTIIYGGGPTRTLCLFLYPVACDRFHSDEYLRTYFNGVIGERSEVGMQSITDGTSHTLLVGEKYLMLGLGTTKITSWIHILGQYSDDYSMYQGNGPDIVRWCRRDLTPSQDRRGFDLPSIRFGSAHPGSFQGVFCDGSVRAIAYDVDGGVFEALGSRNGGEVQGLE